MLDYNIDIIIITITNIIYHYIIQLIYLKKQ